MNKTNILYTAVIAAVSSASFAQDATPGTSLALEEVIVTAQKREQTLQDVPVSVAVISGTELAERANNEISELSRMTPGFSFAEGSSDAGRSVTVRGVGTRTFSRGVEQSVGTVVDGVVASGVASSLLDFSDVARVEVLRGPQGMLFGKNASAGLLNIVTNRPTEEFSASIGGSYADENEVKFNGFVSGPLGSDSLLGRLSFYSNERDPNLENIFPGGEDYNDRDEWGYRLKVAWEPSDDISTLLSVVHAERDHICCMAVPVEVTPGSKPDLAGTPRGKEDNKINENDDSWGQTDLDVYSFEFNYYIGDYTLTSITAYTDSKISASFRGIGSPVSFLPLNEGESNIDQFTQELRITSPADQALTYVAGLYYYTREESREFARIIDYVGLEQPDLGIENPGFMGTTLTNDFTVENESYAAFGQLTWHLSERTRLSVGARYNHETVDLKQQIGTIDDVFIVSLPEAPAGSLKVSDSDSAWSGRLIGEFDLAEDVMLYASIARGYKGPGANTLPSGSSAAQPIIDPEIPTSYELGIKSQWWDNRLRINASAYYTSFEDFQASASDGKVPPNYFLANAGELETQGVEIELTAQLSEQLTLWGGIAYIDATYADYDGAACYGSQTPEQGCVDGQQDLSGAPLPNSPEWTFTGSLKYDIPLSSMPFDGFVLGSYYWQDEVHYGGANHPRLVGDSYGLADLTLGIAANDGRYTVQLFAKNLFDDYWVTSMSDVTVVGLPLVHNIDYTYTRRIGISAQVWF